MKPIEEYDDPEEWMADTRRYIDDLTERAEQASEILKESKGIGDAANGGVRVVVAQGGQLESLDINDEAIRLGPTRLSSAIKAAFMKANAALALSAREAVVTIAGEETTDNIFSQLNFPSEEELAEIIQESPGNDPWEDRKDDIPPGDDDEDPGARWRGGILR